MTIKYEIYFIDLISDQVRTYSINICDFDSINFSVSTEVRGIGYLTLVFAVGVTVMYKMQFLLLSVVNMSTIHNAIPSGYFLSPSASLFLL